MIVGFLCIDHHGDTYVHAIMVFDDDHHMRVTNALRRGAGTSGEWVSAITLEPRLPILIDQLPFKLEK